MGYSIKEFPASAGVGWYRNAIRIFKVDPVKWVIFAVLILATSFVLSGIPFVGAVVSNVLISILSGSAYIAASRMDDDGNPIEEQIPMLAIDRAKPLALSGLLFLGIAGAIFLLAIIVVAGAVGLLVNQSTALWVPVGLMLAIPFALAMAVAVYCFVLAPGFIVSSNTGVIDSWKLAVSGIRSNVAPLFVVFLIGTGFMIGSVITLGLGLFVAIPLSFISTYAWQKDIFIFNPED